MGGSEDRMKQSPALPRDADGPVFREPWEAKAFAMAVRLADDGVFTWPEWTEALSNEIAFAHEAGDPDLGDTYYMYWMRALETLVASKSSIDASDIDHKAEAWRDAYLNTPHGQPIELSAVRASR